MVTIHFDQGTLTLHGTATELTPAALWTRWDERSRCFRAEGRHYGPIMLALHKRNIPFDDKARLFQRHAFTVLREDPPRPFQQAALTAWRQQQMTGVVVLPTGAGKTLVARQAITSAGRDTLILVPTLELMTQWARQLERTFGPPIGLLGGGGRDLQPITVATYDSAVIYMEHIGNRFGLLICDECHHLPATANRQAAMMCLAPFRLGLTATPERTDGGEQHLFDLLGPLCYRVEINELEGSYLAPYQVEHLAIQLDPDEREAYEAARGEYREFARANGISFRHPSGWTQFIRVCARSQEGRSAFAAYHTQKRLARASRAKLRAVWQLLQEHRGERVLLFTDDNATAYTIGETFFLPVITHHTKVPERKKLLDGFRSGTLTAMVTSRVLNEGVDVPEVAVGIVVSGTGSVREHVQRLGRLLRPGADKQAVLYELVSEDTGETFTSERRRQHLAYQKLG